MGYQTPFLRSVDEDVDIEEQEKHDECWDMICKNTVVAVENDSEHGDVWLIKILDNNCIVDEPESDDYGNTVLSGVRWKKTTH